MGRSRAQMTPPTLAARGPRFGNVQREHAQDDEVQSFEETVKGSVSPDLLRSPRATGLDETATPACFAACSGLRPSTTNRGSFPATA
jgi:hypothetical protein